MLHPSLIERITRSLAYMLRHQPEQFDLEVDEFGFADVEDVVAALNERLGEPVEADDVVTAVEGGDRPRYEIREGRIRALYGHSIQVKPGEPTKPPDLLYVGISKDDADRARRYGLRPGRRSFLHLALSPEDALETGRRTSRDYVVVKVNAVDAWEEGINFYDRKSLFLSGPIPTHFLEVGDVRTDGYVDESGGERGERGGRGRREERPRDDRPRDDRPRDERPHEDRSRDDRPREERPRSEPSEPPRRREWRDRQVEPQEARAESRPSEGSGTWESAPPRPSEPPARDREGDRRGPRGHDRRGRGEFRQEPRHEHAGHREDRGPPRHDREGRGEGRGEGHRGPRRGPPRDRPGDRPGEGFGRPSRPPPPARPAPGGLESTRAPVPAASASSASDSFGSGIFDSAPEKSAPPRREPEAPPRAESRPAPAEPPRAPARPESDDSGFGAGI